MAGFFTGDGRHYVSIITGPSHVLLGARFSREPAEPAMVRRPPVSTCPHEEMDAQRIRAMVREGLAALKEKGEGEIHAAEIAYVEDDSPRYDMFRYAACLLARHYLGGGEFKPMFDPRA